MFRQRNGLQSLNTSQPFHAELDSTNPRQVAIPSIYQHTEIDVSTWQLRWRIADTYVYRTMDQHVHFGGSNDDVDFILFDEDDNNTANTAVTVMEQDVSMTTISALAYIELETKNSPSSKYITIAGKDTESCSICLSGFEEGDKQTHNAHSMWSSFSLLVHLQLGAYMEGCWN